MTMEPHSLLSSPPRVGPSLLPAFEPLSSSPSSLPRQTTKRKYDEHVRDDNRYYPTPVPTSSTGIIPSSPNARAVRPKLQRSVSALSERAPLGAVPSLEIPGNGEPLHMGRSSNSSDYQLSSNRLISRVHVRAKYNAPSEQHPEGEVIVECMGWNGCKISYLGQVLELAKGEKFASHKPAAQIMVDVQDTRVILVWPVRSAVESRAMTPCPLPSSPPKQKPAVDDLPPSSPPPVGLNLRSPRSLSPAMPVNTTFASTIAASQLSNHGDQVEVYEDHESADEGASHSAPKPEAKATPLINDGALNLEPAESTQSSTLSEPEDLSEHDEENDPIVLSFGPYGDNLLNKFSSFKSTASPDLRGTNLSAQGLGIDMPSDDEVVPGPPRVFRESPVKNHVINQLAYSRVHSIPLSTIFSNVPADMKKPKVEDDGETKAETSILPMTKAELKKMINAIPCVGKISREGKDAAGKALEDEFYYLPDADKDDMRRTAVNGGRPPLRNVRKQHKQYYWKKPR